MTWMSRVCATFLVVELPQLDRQTDKEWLDALNAERKKDQLDKISYETFEVVMDRLEKEWFDLVRLLSLSCRRILMVLS